MQNICKFIPPARAMDHIQTINFVYEAKPAAVVSKNPNPVYQVHYVTGGSGTVRCGDVEQTVQKGDVFFVFPAVPYTIFCDGNFQYMYISYIGIRAAAEMERLGITRKNFVFRNLGMLEGFWKEAIGMRNELMDLTSESVLLYTLSQIGTCKLADDKTTPSASTSNFLLIKKYIDEHFADANLSCEAIALHFSYNKKYISMLFKKNFELSITEYIHTVRVNHACVLIEEGETNVGKIAESVGFQDALYFSKIFKRHVGSSPKQYINLRK